MYVYFNIPAEIIIIIYEMVNDMYLSDLRKSVDQLRHNTIAETKIFSPNKQYFIKFANYLFNDLPAPRKLATYSPLDFDTHNRLQKKWKINPCQSRDPILYCDEILRRKLFLNMGFPWIIARHSSRNGIEHIHDIHLSKSDRWIHSSFVKNNILKMHIFIKHNFNKKNINHYGMKECINFLCKH
tara:strand:+ start:418 stop:969 length:552 start_codon:yes stop_codon:yes gene_type:complete